MSELFKDIFQKFKAGKRLGGRGANVLSTRLGKCVVRNAQGEKVKYTCVEKTFSDKRSLDLAVRGFIYLQGKTLIKDYFPEVYHISNEDKTIRMAYFACETLEHYFQSIDLFDKSNERKINGIFLSINDLLNSLIFNDIVHGDLHSGNVLVCLSKYEPMANLKVIDLDEAGPIKKPVAWDDATKTLVEDDMNGQGSDKYSDASVLGENIRRDLLTGLIRKIRGARTSKRARVTIDRDELQKRIEDRLHEFSNLGKLCMNGWDIPGS